MGRRRGKSKLQHDSTTTLTVDRGMLQRQCISCGQHTLAGGVCPVCEQQGNHLLGIQAEDQGRSLVQRSPDPSGFSHDISRVPVRQRRPLVQAKLIVGVPGDQYEQEADRVADQVMRMPAPEAASETTAHQPQRLQQTNEDEVQRQYEEEAEETLKKEEDEEEKAVQTKERSGQVPTVTPGVEAQLSASQGRGQPLSPETRSFMEPRFEQDFSGVRVHTDANAAQLNRNLNAQAFTHGQNVFFGAGRYSPQTGGGRRLLAHELAHVVQQQAEDFTPKKWNNTVQLKAAPESDKIRSNLSYGLLDWAVTEEEIHDVLIILKPLSDQDLRDTLLRLGNKLIDRIFTNASDQDKKVEADLLERIRRFRPGKALLVHLPEFLICKEPPKGPWEIAGQFNSLPELLNVVDKMSKQVDPPVGPRYFSRLGILAHGDSAGVIKIGSTIVTHKNIDSFTGDFSALSKYLMSDGDLYIFGCISGRGEAGSTLLKKISLCLPGRRIIGFNVIISLAPGEAKVPGEMCAWPKLEATDITSDLFKNDIRERVPATDTAPQAKIAKDGEIIKWPSKYQSIDELGKGHKK